MAVSGTAVESTAISGHGASLVNTSYNPLSSATITYASPATIGTTGAVTHFSAASTGTSSIPLSSTHTSLSAHPTGGMLAAPAHTYATTTDGSVHAGTTEVAGFTNFVAGPVVDAGGKSFTNNFVVTHGATEEYKTSYAEVPTTSVNYTETSMLQAKNSSSESRLFHTDPAALNPPEIVTGASNLNAPEVR